MFIYSAIVLFDTSDDEAELKNLQSELAEKFAGKSVLNLPPHITLMKWKSQEPILDSLYSTFAGKNLSCEILLDSIKISNDKKSIWYEVVKHPKLINLYDYLYKSLIINGISQGDIISYPNFHVTIAYKDYSEYQIAVIFRFIMGKNLAYLRVSTDRVVCCTYSQDNGWSIME